MRGADVLLDAATSDTAKLPKPSEHTNNNKDEEGTFVTASGELGCGIQEVYRIRITP